LKITVGQINGQQVATTKSMESTVGNKDLKDASVAYLWSYTA